MSGNAGIEEIKERNKQVISEVLTAYPEKSAKKRAKHLSTYEADKPDCGVKSNLKTIPGVMTIRGCAYAGSKGVVWGPIKDMVHISHGPVGCGQYSWASRRNYFIGATGVDAFGTMQFTSDFQENDIVFGGDKKLAKIIDEIEGLFPLNKGISIQSEQEGRRQRARLLHRLLPEIHAEQERRRSKFRQRDRRRPRRYRHRGDGAGPDRCRHHARSGRDSAGMAD